MSSTPTADPRTSATREHLLDAAEELFGRKGYAATSLRELTAAAGTNLAAVNYHFGGKEELCKAVLARRIGPINAERLRRLDALAGRRATANAIVRAFVEPPLRATVSCAASHEHDAACASGLRSTEGTRLCRLFGRISIDQPAFLRDFLTEQFRGLGERFARELAKVRKGLDPGTTWWRMHFIVGAMAHTLQSVESLPGLSAGLCDPNDPDRMIEELVAFAVGGLRAAAPQPGGERAGKAKKRPKGKAVRR